MKFPAGLLLLSLIVFFTVGCKSQPTSPAIPFLSKTELLAEYDSLCAALREAHEEILLDPSAIELVGAIEPYRTVTGYIVTPLICVVPPDLPLEPHEHEVAAWFEAPLQHLLDPANQCQRSALFQGRERHYYEIIWEGRRIWGATAAMIVNLSRRLQWR